MIDSADPGFWSDLVENVAQATWETLYMVLATMLITWVVGLAVGVVLVATDRGGILQAPFGSRALGRTINILVAVVVNITRSIPFVILMIALIPVTFVLIGTSFGSTAAIVPLSVAAVPFFARIVEIAVREVSPGKVEAADALGATRWQILSKVLVPEAMPAIVRGFTTTVISIINFSAIAGVIGAGGLGDLAIRYGYQRYSTEYIVAVVLVLLVLVQVLQSAGGLLAARLDHERPRSRRRARTGAAPTAD
ncbi:methionine ABC transporter permease [Microbacterium aquimaris]|uniref:Methionine ABC transporter permease n=1 Tax=Microbacterium aquimaris TaxID=459816 RepID=A0ABU5N754_9MICO|nr:methionine ABC transporter permease [Microbacterium aquimaris]MDZ8161903.1 methionine ABC transporter permease [Microbacterium aquimaris]